MFQPVSSRVNFPALEERILQFWREKDIFRRSVEERPEHNLYVFYEGPPTANGMPGIHHVLARVFKDLFPRYKTMRGYRVPRKGGWDTHGLPVELEVEKELGLRSKPEIERYGIEAFNAKCRESVFRYVKEWERMTERIGFWIDMEQAYITYDNGYIETCWWIFKQLWDHGLIYQDYRSTPHCPRCGTSLSDHEVALGYQENTPDPSIYVKFRVTQEGAVPAELRLHEGVPTFILAWTTTPWTLPGNTALAVDREASYVLVEVARDGQKERFVLAEALLDAAVPGEKTVLARFPGRALLGVHYEPLYRVEDWGVPLWTWEKEHLQQLRGVPAEAPPRRVIGAPFVSMEDGTGVVHIAPAFGSEDFQIGREEGLLFVQPVDLRGQMTGNSPFAGRFVKDADPMIIEDLRRRGLLWRSGTIRHTYPFCWRCDTPLLYYAKPSWYIRTTAVKEQLIKGNLRINWYPEYIKYGRFGDWLEHNVDWAVSRERYWGTPLPFWRCEQCGTVECFGSIAELRERATDPRAVDALTDLHRPYIDAITVACRQCSGIMVRVPEVADAWFDSGAMPYAQWHYPFENQETFRRNFPADFICEAIDQTRGWFYTLHAEATLLWASEAVPESIAYRNVVCLGHILDEKGAKMSKHLGNVVDPWTVLDKHGADAVRWYMYTATPPGQPRRFSADLVGESLRKFLLTLWNTYSFFVTYARISNFDPRSPVPTERPELDRWVLSRLHGLIAEVTDDVESYNPTDAGRAIQEFVDDLSNWYVRRSRRRFWKTGDVADSESAFHTLYTCLVTLSKLLAPFTPFVAEELYQNLVRSWDSTAPESVHLERWPEADLRWRDEQLEAETRLVMRLVSLGRAARAKAGVKVRQPLQQVLIKLRSADEREAIERLADQLLDELNVKELVFIESEAAYLQYQVKPNLPVLGPKLSRDVPHVTRALAEMDAAQVVAMVQQGRPVQVAGHELSAEDLLIETTEREGFAAAQEAGYTVLVTTAITPGLADEGLARELVRRLQEMRRSADFDISDRIVTYYLGDGDIQRVMQSWSDYIRQETLSRELIAGPPSAGAYQETQDVDGHRVTLGVERVGRG